MITKSQEIRSLDPDSMFSIHEDVIKWDTPEISDAKINAEMARLQTEYNNNEYQRQRALAYAPLTEQLDYIYHNGIEAWKTDMINPVKTKYPKGSV